MGPMLFAALVPLNHPDYYFHWHFIEISAANAIVIGLMLVTFVAALLLPFPGRRRRKENRLVPPKSTDSGPRACAVVPWARFHPRR